MKELKKEYNVLLERFHKGMEYTKGNEQDEKAKKTLEEIEKKMAEIIQKIGEGNYTPEEAVNGFIIEEEVVEVNAEVVENVPAIAKPKENKSVVIRPQVDNSLEMFNQNWGIAEKLAKSTIIPDNYKGRPENVIIALGMAQKIGLDPFTVMQNLNIVKGKTSWGGSFCKTLIEMTGRFKNLELNYIGKKGTDTYGCYLSAIRVSDGKIINGPEVTIAMAKAEGWISNKKWSTMPELMLGYRCQSFFARLYAPEAMNGIYTSEEMEDIDTKKVQREYEDIL